MESAAHSLQTVFLLLLLFVAIFAIVAQRLRVPYPIVLVVAGLGLSLVPGIPDVELNPDTIFFVVLPLLLNWAAWHTSWLSLRRNAWSIFVLAFGLVVFTVFGVAAAAPWFLPGFDWRAGFVLGAVIAPTDAIAATSIARRLRLPQRIVDIIEGESLINDASGLLALQIGVGMIMAGRTPTVSESLARLAFITVAGIAIGVVVGFVVDRFERVVDDAPIVIALTLLVPYAAYFAAESVHASGVLAVIASGLYHSRSSVSYRPARVRLQAEVVWNTMAFIVNGLVFVLIGLQLPAVLAGLKGTSISTLIADVLLFSAIVVALRMAWVYPALSVGRAKLDGRSKFLIGWASMRGVIALAAALSLPLQLPQRAMIIFLTFGGIFTSLVIKGLTLPAFIRRLGLAGRDESQAEEIEARKALARAGLEYLDHAHGRGEVFDEHEEDLRRHYATRLAALNDEPADDHGGAAEHAARYREVSRGMLRAERAEAVRLRDENRITDDTLRELLTELDLAETRLNVELEKTGRV